MCTKYSHIGNRINSPTLILSYVVLIMLLFFQPVNAQMQDSIDLFKKDFFKMFGSSSKKMISLCDSIPSRDFDWQPVAEIRSVKEVFIHVARTNYYLASKINFPIPKGIEPSKFLESASTKEATKKILLNSIEHIRKAIQQVDKAQMYSNVDFWGGKETMQRIILQVGEHMAEHLGQLIIYARTRGVTPPWSK